MFRTRFAKHLGLYTMLSLMMSSCYQPPYNNFQPYHPVYKDTIIGAGAGAIVGAAAGPTLAGAGIGALTFGAYGLYKERPSKLIKDLYHADIKYEQYGNTMMLIVPTDRYFLFNSARLNELCYHSLVRMVMLLKHYPSCVFYVAGFTDSTGSRHHKNKLSQAQAETMLTFLWANGIQAKRLHAEGYGDKHDVSDNKLIHGSAHNRRLEIQCVKNSASVIMPYMGPTK